MTTLTRTRAYDFILAQQDTSKKLLNVKLSFGEYFQKYIRQYLAGITAKYLFYRYNDFLHMRNLEMSLIRHTKIAEDCEGFFEIQNIDWFYFIEKVIAVTEGLSKIDLSEKETKTAKEITKNYKICKESIKFFLLLSLENFKEYISTLDYSKINEINKDVKTNDWAFKNN